MPSHGVGYEIGYALNAGKPVLCLVQEGRRVSKMITGNPSLEMQMYSTLEEALAQVRMFLNAL